MPTCTKVQTCFKIHLLTICIKVHTSTTKYKPAHMYQSTHMYIHQKHVHIPKYSSACTKLCISTCTKEYTSTSTKGWTHILEQKCIHNVHTPTYTCYIYQSTTTLYLCLKWTLNATHWWRMLPLDFSWICVTDKLPVLS